MRRPRALLEAELVAWMHEGTWRPDEARFARLALELFAFQFGHCPPYRAFCERRGATPERVGDWRTIPAVPTAAFKEVALRCFPPESAVRVFRTSGTTGARRGELYLDTLELYEASLLPSFRRSLLPELPAGARARILALAPPPEQAPDSSLTHMFATAIAAFGAPGSGFFVDAGVLRERELLAALEAAGDGPCLLAGTTFAFVHLVDGLAAREARLALPDSLRVMETGGPKGRSRTVTRGELHAELEARLGVPAARIVNQYGMTELASQFYDSTLAEPGTPRRKLGPPWARVVIVDPEAGGPAAPGEPGAIVVHDLANTGGVAAIRTADLGRRIADGFEVLGREPGAEERGCSISADFLLSGAAG
jgi:acyl-CoA synthetase (AMP-forming)/AMP-acid ligase II